MHRVPLLHRGKKKKSLDAWTNELLRSFDLSSVAGRCARLVTWIILRTRRWGERKESNTEDRRGKVNCDLICEMERIIALQHFNGELLVLWNNCCSLLYANNSIVCVILVWTEYDIEEKLRMVILLCWEVCICVCFVRLDTYWFSLWMILLCSFIIVFEVFWMSLRRTPMVLDSASTLKLLFVRLDMSFLTI